MTLNQNYRASRLLLSLLFLCCSFSLTAFQKPLKLSELYLQLIDSQEEYLEISNQELIDDMSGYDKTDAHNFFESLTEKTGREIPIDSIWLKSSVKELRLINVTGASISVKQLKLDVLALRSSQFRTLEINGVNAGVLSLDSVKVISIYNLANSTIGSYEEFDNTMHRAFWDVNTFTDFVHAGNSVISEEFYISDCTFKDGGYIGVSMPGNFSDFRFSSNVFEPTSRNTIQYSADSTEGHLFKTQLQIVHYIPVKQWIMFENVFQPGLDEELVILDGEVSTLLISDNDFGSTLIINTEITKHLDLVYNKFHKKLDITNVVLSAKNNEIRWGDMTDLKMSTTDFKSKIAGNAPDPMTDREAYQKLFKQSTGNFYVVYNGKTEDELENEETFQKLISSYYRLYKVFKENGEVKSANRVYVEMKDVELRELSYKWKNEGGFENWINWRLNRLLRFYTDYGTNPSKAISISVLVVLIFSVFYFFFPSEWDTKSKGQLVADYRIFVEKNDKGYARPLMNLSLGFGKSLINAMTLSLNSFVTLGFGSIPTTGLARYICILQGFLGWFLLSIFTASLINQVMF